MSIFLALLCGSMCYELFKDGVLVYSDCKHNAPPQNTTLANGTFNYNRTVAPILNLTNTTNATNSTQLYQGVLLPPNTTMNVSMNVSKVLSSNSSANLTNCWPAPSPCVCNDSAVVSDTEGFHESVVDANDTVQNASTATVVYSDAKAISPPSHEWWIVVILCLCLFALFVLRAYSVHLRRRLAFMRGRSVAPDTRLKDVVPTAYPEEPPPTPSSSASVSTNTTSATEKVIAKKKMPALKHNTYKVNAAKK